MDDLTYNGIKLPSWNCLKLINILFFRYSTLKHLRSDSADELTWMDYLEILSCEMTLLVEKNLSPEHISEYKSYIRNNDWSNDLAIRRSCKNIDKAVNFLKVHFAPLKGGTPPKLKYLKLVK